MGASDFDHAKKYAKRGRAAFVPTGEQRATVRRLATDRLARAAIAATIGISIPTLRKAFAVELCALSKFTAPRSGPVHDAKEEDREKVAVLIAAGMNVDEIARAMALSEPTLRRLYGAEIETGALRKRSEMLMALNRVALKGNVAALKESLAIMDRASLEALQGQFRGRKGEASAAAPAAPAPAPPAAEPQGKKVAAELAAHSVVTKGPWGDLLRKPKGRAG